MSTMVTRALRKPQFGLAAALALIVVLLPAAAGLVAGHAATVHASLACNGNVTYYVTDWTNSDTGGQAETTLHVSYQLNGTGSYTTWDTLSFTSSNYKQAYSPGINGTSFNVGSANSVKISVQDTVWGDGQGPYGPYTTSITRPSGCHTPSVTTLLSGTSVVVGTAVSDKATLHNASSDAGGTVQYTVYTNSGCTAGAIDAGKVTVTNAAVPGSNAIPFTTTGTWYWQAVYSGDTGNKGATSPCTDEILTVTQASPAINTTPSGAIVLGSGNELTDSATLSGGYNPTGTITFTLTAPNSSVVDTETVSVSGNGSYVTPTGFVPTMAGTWYWVASYSGDSNNKSVSGGKTDEPVVVSQASPKINTTPSGTIILGSGDKLTDGATLSGGYNPTGTITFKLYDPANALAHTESATVSGNGTYKTSVGFEPTMAGTWYWVASYGGDSNNKPVSGGKTDEPVVVTPDGPEINTTPSGTIVLGSGDKLTDTATLSGGYNPSGTITFTLTDPNNAVADTETVTVSGNGTYKTPVGLVPTMAGTWHWVASYSGDDNNKPVSGGPKDEPVVVSPADPDIDTTPSGSVVLGSGDKLTDSATLSGGYNPTGTITFKLHDPTNTVVDTETVSVSGNGSYVTPTGFVPTMAGTWYWVASYSGDDNNTPASGGPKDEPVVVSPVGPVIATKLSGKSVDVGTSVKDSATLSGATSDAGGTVQYTVYTSSECAGTSIDAGLVHVNKGVVPDSNTVTFDTVGTWYWQAVYSGDTNNKGATSACTEEVLTVNATPTPTATATATSFESFQGETATPEPSTTLPPTATGTSRSGGDSAPTLALLICLCFGVMGLLAVQTQRRSIRR